MFKGKLLTLIVPIYVDDLLPLGDKPLVDDFETFLPESFEVSSMGDASFFLGLRIRRKRKDWRLILDQHTGDKGPNNHWAHCEHIENTGNM